MKRFLHLSGLVLLGAGCGSVENTGSDPAPLKRLTAVQFDNTIDDLLPELERQKVHFPHSLSVGGFDNNTAVNSASASLVEVYHQAAGTLAANVVEQADTQLGCDPAEDPFEECVIDWFKTFSQRAWRRPLSEAEWSEIESSLIQWDSEFDASIALQLGIQYLLQSPDFLYLIEEGVSDPSTSTERSLTAWELASRLSYFLWASMPDSALFAAAENGTLLDRDVLEQQALRMLEHPKAKEGLKDFTRQWLDLDRIGSNEIDFETYFPDNPDEEQNSDYLHQLLQPLMRFEPEVFVDRIVFHSSGTLAELLNSERTWTSPETAHLYGDNIEALGPPVEWPVELSIEGVDYAFDVPYYPTAWNNTERVGLLGLSGFLHSHSKPVFPSPVLRGVFVLEKLICQPPGAPPEDVPAIEGELDTGPIQTNRDRYAAHSANSACAACHDRIDGVGFPFEHFDSLGQWRATDNGFPVDASGEIIGTDVDGPVVDAVDLSQKLATSRTVHDCFSTQLFRYAFARAEDTSDQAARDFYEEGFWESQGDIPELMLNITTSKAFRTLRGAE